MEAVGSRLGRASSRYGSTTVFTGPVRKWKKKWVHVTPSSSPSNSNTNNNAHAPANSNASSLLLLRRWTPTTDDDAAATDEPPRRKFRYTPIAVLEEQKKNMVKDENEPATESDQSEARQTNVIHEMQGKLNMNEMSEETKDSNIVRKDDDGLVDLQSHNDETSQNSDTQLENNV
ncbi:uncharacterized protein LOC124841745 isoform X1 [Vigna umbellata]|uniref:uncharacterized protein LOC124841745 isoform X1 n=1 Tax=Vigna umbellata TaxID=87088 RepID=UPI001F5E632D|nr:uncharacterized protein LOC124841745 isoform X1 [Vigna umbellata]